MWFQSDVSEIFDIQIKECSFSVSCVRHYFMENVVAASRSSRLEAPLGLDRDEADTTRSPFPPHGIRRGIREGCAGWRKG